MCNGVTIVGKVHTVALSHELFPGTIASACLLG